jgi:hypothetical protein
MEKTYSSVPSVEWTLTGCNPEPEFCKRLRSPGIGSKESIPPAYVAWRAGMFTIGLSYPPARLGIDSWAPLKGLKIRAVFLRLLRM